jgi:transposase InsO family protein
MLEGRAFTIFTDHKPLTFALARTTDPWTARQCRQLSYIAEFTSDIQHIKGTDNTVADTLSRPPDVRPTGEAAGVKAPSGSPAATAVAGFPVVSSLLLLPAGVDYTSIAAHQQDYQVTKAALAASSLLLKTVNVAGADLLCDLSTGTPRPVNPMVDRRPVFEAFHSLAHPGIRASKRLVSSRVVWPRMAADIASWCRDCVSCQRAKVTKQATTAVAPIPIPAKRFSHIHVDLVGPLPASADGFKYIFTIIDRSTRWLEAVPLRDMEANSCVTALLHHWICKFGVPAANTTDRGRQFISSIWSSTCQQLGIEHIMTTAYHPQSNGMVERSHRQVKDSLRARLAGPDWPSHLLWVLLGLHAAPKEDTNISSAELVFGAPLALPGELLVPYHGGGRRK